MVGSMTPPHEPSSPMDGGIRKRVCKACDRCRLKKSKCDGSSPCSRCKADNAICFFGERKKSHDKVYPKGYVEMLENQQAQLVSGLQELYRRLQNGQGWTGSPLKESSSTGSPLTHDILERLGALKQEGQSSNEVFEENLEAMQQKLIANGASFVARDNSFDAASDFDHTAAFDHNNHKTAPSFINPFQASHFPPTPPHQSPHQRMSLTTSPLKQFPVEVPQMSQFPTWPAEYDDSMDFMSCEPTNDLNLDAMSAYTSQMYPGSTAINPCLTMKNWDAQQEMQKYFNANVLV